MSGNYCKKEDLRIKKTRKALVAAMVSLLNRKKFDRITVNDLCDEALVSRAAFYAHFENKYDLIRHWIDMIKEDFKAEIHTDTEEQIMAKINDLTCSHAQVLLHLVDEHNIEVLKQFFDALAYVILEKFIIIEEENCPSTNSNLILLEFFAGGMTSLFVWQVKNKFQMDKDEISDYLYRIIKNISEWKS